MNNLLKQEFKFLKGINNVSTFNSIRVDHFDEIILSPICILNHQKHNFKNYFKNNEILYFEVEMSEQNTIIKLEINKSSKILINQIKNHLNQNLMVQIINYFKNVFLTEVICPGINLTHITGKSLILTAGPSISYREKIYVNDALINGWNNQWNKYLSIFEKEFAKYIGVKYAIATSSCTGAMHIALAALDLKKGDEVIVPDITWVSTANAVMLVGATPIFADVDIETWTLDPKSVESLITDKTKAIMPVHLYGHPAKMDEIMSISKEYNLKIIEDAAPSIGAEFKGKKTGSFGDFSAFSFQGAKLLVTGEGGMLCTNNKDLYDKAYKIWDQGRVPGTFWIEELSSKYKMANIQAAIGIGQLQRNDLMVNKKRIINDWYFKRLKNIKGIKFFRETKNVKSIYWMSCIIIDKQYSITREELCKKLKEKNVDTRPVFPTISQYPYWIKKQKEQPNSKFISERAINLPSGVCLSKHEVDYVCDQIIKIFDR